MLLPTVKTSIFSQAAKLENRTLQKPPRTPSEQRQHTQKLESLADTLLFSGRKQGGRHDNSALPPALLASKQKRELSGYGGRNDVLERFARDEDVVVIR